MRRLLLALPRAKPMPRGRLAVGRVEIRNAGFQNTKSGKFGERLFLLFPLFATFLFPMSAVCSAFPG